MRKGEGEKGRRGESEKMGIGQKEFITPSLRSCLKSHLMFCFVNLSENFEKLRVTLSCN